MEIHADIIGNNSFTRLRANRDEMGTTMTLFDFRGKQIRELLFLERLEAIRGTGSAFASMHFAHDFTDWKHNLARRFFSALMAFQFFVIIFRINMCLHVEKHAELLNEN